MKWFKKKEEPVKEGGIGNFAPLESETPKEMIDVKASGKYSVGVIEKEDRYTYQHPYTVFFKYNFDVEFIGMKIKSKGHVCFEPPTESRRYYGTITNSEEEAYKYAIELLSEKENEIVEAFKMKIESDIKKYIQEKRIDELKNIIKNKNSFDVNLSFQIEKPKK